MSLSCLVAAFLAGMSFSSAVAAQEVEIISGGAAPLAGPEAAGPGVRVIAFVEADSERAQHRVVSPLLPEEILLIQERLAAAGTDPGVRDGLLGAETVTALSRYQEESALEPCGCVNFATVVALGMTPNVVQTVIGVPEDESDAEVVVGNTQLPETPAPVVVPAAAPPETVTVVHQVNHGWWYPRFFSAFPPRGDAPGAGVGGGRPGFPIGPVLRLGAPRAVPPGR